jgi:hypothetical protein
MLTRARIMSSDPGKRAPHHKTWRTCTSSQSKRHVEPAPLTRRHFTSLCITELVGRWSHVSTGKATEGTQHSLHCPCSGIQYFFSFVSPPADCVHNTATLTHMTICQFMVRISYLWVSLFSLFWTFCIALEASLLVQVAGPGSYLINIHIVNILTNL